MSAHDDNQQLSSEAPVTPVLPEIPVDTPSTPADDATQTTEMNDMILAQPPTNRLHNIPILGNMIQAYKSYSNLIIHRKEFRWMWLGGVISTVGNMFSHIAAITIIERVFNEGHGSSGSAISGIFLASFIPPILLMPITGVVADMFDRRKVMLISDLSRIFVSLCFLFVLINPQQLYYILYIVLVIMWSLNSFFDPCREGLIPLIVPKEELVAANALESLTWMCCSFLGSFLGGLVVSYFGVGANFILDAVTFILSSLCILQLFKFDSLKPEQIKKSLEMLHEKEKSMVTQDIEMSTPTLDSPVYLVTEELIEEPVVKEEEPRKTFAQQVLLQMKEFVIGIRYIFTNPYILTLTMIKATSALNYSPRDFVTMKMCFEVFQPQGVISDAAATYGYYRALVGVSSGLFPVIVERILPKNYTARTMRLVVLACLCIVVPAYGIVVLFSDNIYGK
jgi:MFS family permease